MVTGTSTSDLSVILIDARKGVLSQSKRHAAISSLLGVRHLVVAINKMDLVEFDEAVFDEIGREFGCFAHRLGITNVTTIPISALLGDNVVEPSENMPWYSGPTLLQFLEEVDVNPSQDFITTKTQPVRLPVQFVIRPDQDYRGFAGRLESGRIGVGDTLVVSSSGLSATVRSIRVAGAPSSEAHAGQAVAIQLNREIDVSRGDLLFSPSLPPTNGNRVEAVVCWMDDRALELGKRYLLLHGASRVSATVETLLNRVDIDTLETPAATTLALNDIGRIVIHTSKDLFFDKYTEIPALGSFVLVDPSSHATVAGGMIAGLVDGEKTKISRLGNTFLIESWTGDLTKVCNELRRFGKQIVSLSIDDFPSVDSVDPLVKRLAEQGIDVILSGFNSLHAVENGFVIIPSETIGNEANLVEYLLEVL